MAFNPNNPNGSATSANSQPVVIASDQAALPLPTGAASSANQTNGTQQAKITDGTNVATVKAASTAAVAADKAVVVAVSPNNTIPVSLASAPTTAVTGTFWQATQPVSLTSTTVTGTVTVDSELPAAAALADGASNPTVPGVGGFGMVYNGSTWERLRGDLGDASGATGVLVNNPLVYNGSTYDRLRSAAGAPTGTLAVTDQPATSGGLSIVTGSVGATATAIKASAGQLYGYHLFNTTAAVAYVQIFNVAAGSVTLGTTAPTFSIGIPASGGVTVNWDKGIAFGTAISFGCTTTRTGSTGATCDVNFFYK